MYKFPMYFSSQESLIDFQFTCCDHHIVWVAVVAGGDVELTEGGQDLLAGRRHDPPLAAEIGRVVVRVAWSMYK